MRLPDYQPPPPRKAIAACAGSPLIVLSVFVALVLRWIDLELAAAWLVGATAWVGWEMHDYQRTIDAYNRHYAQHHLDGHPPHRLKAWAEDGALPVETREFVLGYIAAGCRCEPDRPRL